MAQGHSDTSQQLTGAEGFGQIIIGTGIQRPDLILFLVPGGDHDDRDFTPLPQALGHLETVEVREAQVQQD
jgi:hypothetical protein